MIYDFNLIKASTVVASGKYDVDAIRTITIEIYGTATSASVKFYAQGKSGVNRVLSGVRLSDLAVGTSGGMNEIWTFEVTGTEYFVVSLESVSGGNVTIDGKGVE